MLHGPSAKTPLKGHWQRKVVLLFLVVNDARVSARRIVIGRRLFGRQLENDTHPQDTLVEAAENAVIESCASQKSVGISLKKLERVARTEQNGEPLVQS